MLDVIHQCPEVIGNERRNHKAHKKNEANYEHKFLLTFFILFVEIPVRNVKKKPGSEKTEQSSQRICDQIIDIGKPERKNLENFDPQRQA